MADRPTIPSEIEVTPAMIEAGVKVFFAFDAKFESEEDAVRAIVLAMLRAVPPQIFPSPRLSPP